MVAISAQGKLHAEERDAQLEHTIFQICLQCHYNTLKPLGCAPNSTFGPGYRCPECQKSSFVTACTICRFESSAECPLTLLLNKRSKGAVPERRGRERYRKGDCGNVEIESSNSQGPERRKPEMAESGSFEASDMKRECQDILKRFKNNGRKVYTVPRTRNSQPKHEMTPPTPSRTSPPRPEIPALEPQGSIHTKTSQAPVPLKEIRMPAEKPREYCTQCSQARCETCKPGYMNLVVDMKEFSITFASEMALCTMCEHWLCPGSSLVVLYRCRDCEHEGCDGCATNDDGLGEEWVVCCGCAKTKERNELVVDEARS